MARDPKLPLNETLLGRPRAMRKQPAPAERTLWNRLRDRQLDGLKFRRQHVIGSYIADFYCHEAGLVIEIDGDSNDERDAYDATRTKVINRGGYRVIRFLNADVHRHIDAVLSEIAAQCRAALSSDAPSP